MIQSKSEKLEPAETGEAAQAEPLTHAQLKNQLAILAQGCAIIEAHLNAGRLAIPAKEFSAMQSALLQLKKSNTPPKEKRAKAGESSLAPAVKLGAFIKRHLRHN